MFNFHAYLEYPPKDQRLIFLRLIFITKKLYLLQIFTVNVAQSVEHQIVALGAVGSIPTIHPILVLIVARERKKIYIFYEH